MAVAWLALAVWRTASTGSAQMAVLLAVALVNFAAVGRVVIPWGRER
jgi:hypothetical protein